MNETDDHRRAYSLHEDEGWRYRFGIDFVVKVGETRQGGSAAFMEYVTRKGEEPYDHIHASENEMFYVLDGALTFRCGDEGLRGRMSEAGWQVEGLFDGLLAESLGG